MVTIDAEVILTPGSDENEPIGTLIKLKKTELDFKYPHTCFECGRELRWKEIYIASGNWHLEIKYLKKLWKNKYVQFYCCKCYNIIKFEEDLLAPELPYYEDP